MYKFFFSLEWDKTCPGIETKYWLNLDQETKLGLSKGSLSIMT